MVIGLFCVKTNLTKEAKMKLLCRLFGHRKEKTRDINEFDWEEKCLRCGKIELWGKRIPIYNVKLEYIDEKFWIKKFSK
jgi:hypothetical protein